LAEAFEDLEAGGEVALGALGLLEGLLEAVGDPAGAVEGVDGEGAHLGDVAGEVEDGGVDHVAELVGRWAEDVHHGGAGPVPVEALALGALLGRLGAALEPDFSTGETAQDGGYGITVVVWCFYHKGVSPFAEDLGTDGLSVGSREGSRYGGV